MWIECNNDATDSIYVEDVTDEEVVFSDNGKANVKAKVGKALVNRYDAITESNESDDAGESHDKDDTPY